MHRTHWLILGVGCGVATLYLIIWAWQDFAFVSKHERLLRLGLMIGFAFAGGEWFKRGTYKGPHFWPGRGVSGAVTPFARSCAKERKTSYGNPAGGQVLLRRFAGLFEQFAVLLCAIVNPIAHEPA